MHKRARVLIPVVVIIIAVVVYLTAFRKHDDPNTIAMSGNIEVTDAQLGFKIPGRLLERMVDEGESITTGQALARLEKTDQELVVSYARANVAYAEAVLAELESGSRMESIDQAAAQLSQARSMLDELRNGSRDQDVMNARAQLDRALAGAEAAKSRMDLAEAEKKRYSELYEAGVVSESEYDRITTQYKTAVSSHEEAQAAVESANEMLSLVQEGPREERIDQARAVVRQAQAGYELLKAGPREETLEQARAQVEIAGEALHQAEQQLAYTELTAPFNGIVLSKSAEPGEYLNPGTPVVSIGNLDTVWLRAYINETDLSRVSLGQVVEVTTDTYPDKVYEGRISFISSEAEFTPKLVQTREERVKLMYLVKIELANPNQELKPGMPADCVIHSGE